MYINKERLLRRFCALTAIDSETYHEREMADYLTSELKRLGVTVTEDNSGAITGSQAGNLFACLDGNGEPLLFSAHMDTVVPGKGKRAVIHEDGLITSDGTTVLGSDDCAGLAAILEAAETLIESGAEHNPLELLFTTAEEAYTKGASAFDFSRSKAKLGYFLDLSGKVGAAAYAAPTIMSFELTISGKSAHAGFCPEEGISAISVAASAISELPWGRLDPETTANVGRILGGRAVNIVPDECVVTGEIRSLTHEKAVAAMERVSAVFCGAAKRFGASVGVKSTIETHAYRTALDSEAVRRFNSAAKAVGLNPVLDITLGGSDNNVFGTLGREGLVVACGMNAVHTTDEFTSIDELAASAQLALELMAGK